MRNAFFVGKKLIRKILHFLNQSCSWWRAICQFLRNKSPARTTFVTRSWTKVCRNMFRGCI